MVPVPEVDDPEMLAPVTLPAPEVLLEYLTPEDEP